MRFDQCFAGFDFYDQNSVNTEIGKVFSKDCTIFVIDAERFLLL